MMRSLNGKASPFTSHFSEAACEGEDLGSNPRRVATSAAQISSRRSAVTVGIGSKAEARSRQSVCLLSVVDTTHCATSALELIRLRIDAPNHPI